MTFKQVTTTVRRARMADAAVLWEWANDPATRSSAFSTDPIPWESHVQWFERKLADPRAMVYVAEDHDGLIGQIRFDAGDGDDAEVDVTVAPSRRGRGLGAPLVAAGVEQLGRDRPSWSAVAIVKQDNVASRRSFIVAGFEETGSVRLGGHDVVRFEHRA